ncbi:MAG: metallophosphoesterase, partial [Cyanobacteria bacterium]|nr:metallophosphoesterase [Cyanobacteriota bacterium]
MSDKTIVSPFSNPRLTEILTRLGLPADFHVCSVDPSIEEEVNQKIGQVAITSDLHFHEVKPIGAIRNRPAYETEDQLNDMLVAAHNKVVGSDDPVIFLGDAVHQNAIKQFRSGARQTHPLEVLRRLNGNWLVWVRGNHDRDLTDDEIIEYTGVR